MKVPEKFPQAFLSSFKRKSRTYHSLMFTSQTSVSQTNTEYFKLEKALSFFQEKREVILVIPTAVQGMLEGFQY